MSKDGLPDDDILGGAPDLDSLLFYLEKDLIRRALIQSDKSITRAARKLGLTHQGLAYILNGRHQDLLPERSPVKRRSITKR